MDTSARSKFFDLANQAVEDGLITWAQVEIIYRPGTRKQNYWGRHLRDLQEILAERKSEQSRLG